ncbi:hypothetical protein ACIPJ1_04510 [Microbacterium maritypicum]|uniref:hypothetical protein n=1 Tax=Microbacterium maritypicum TaxID=33918 RepID=UPI0037FE53A1
MPTQATYDAHLARLSRLTFFQLMGTYEPSRNADAVALAALREAAPIRNFIAHRFFWDQAVDFLSYAGREGMLTELSNARARFEELEALLGALVRVTAAEAGIDLDWFKQRLEEQRFVTASTRCCWRTAARGRVNWSLRASFDRGVGFIPPCGGAVGTDLATK